MNINEAKELINEFVKSDLSFMEYSTGDAKLCLKKELSPTVIDTSPTLTSNNPNVGIASLNVPTTTTKELNTYSQIKAPVVGVFYAASSPEAAPFVTEGQMIHKGDVVGLIEAMKMMMEIKSEFTGVVKKIVAKNEEVLGFQDIIMEIEEQG